MAPKVTDLTLELNLNAGQSLLPVVVVLKKHTQKNQTEIFIQSGTLI